jgi:gas vesicle protein
MKEELVSTGNGKSVLLPFLVGGVVGAGIALLLAPKAGREIRKDIKKFAGEAQEKVSSTVERGKELYQEGKSAIVGAYEEGKSAITSAVEAGKTAYMHEKEKRHAA